MLFQFALFLCFGLDQKYRSVNLSLITQGHLSWAVHIPCQFVMFQLRVLTKFTAACHGNPQFLREVQFCLTFHNNGGDLLTILTIPSLHQSPMLCQQRTWFAHQVMMEPGISRDVGSVSYLTLQQPEPHPSTPYCSTMPEAGEIEKQPQVTADLA